MKPLIRHRDEGDAVWFLNSLMTTKASAAETGSFTVSEQIVTSDGNPPLHAHADEEESFYVLDGELEVEVDGERNVLRAGSFALVPRGAPHAYRVTTPTARLLVITGSGTGATNGFEQFYRAVGEPAEVRELPEPSAPDPVALTRIAESHGITIFPPPN